MNKKQLKASIKTTNSTQSIALELAKRACESINLQLGVEIERLGFSVEELDGKKAKLVREVVTADTDPRFISENFIIEKGDIRRIVMSVKWTPNSFEIQRYNDAVANAIKTSPNFRLEKGTPSIVTGEMSQREIDIEARANKYMVEDMKQTAENLKHMEKNGAINHILGK